MIDNRRSTNTYTGPFDHSDKYTRLGLVLFLLGPESSVSIRVIEKPRN